MGFMDDVKDKAEDAEDAIKDKANDLENKAHEEKGKLEGRKDQAEDDAHANDQGDDPTD